MEDNILEELSDKARMGIPISLKEALAVIMYQENKKNKQIEKKSFYKKLLHFFRY